MFKYRIPHIIRLSIPAALALSLSHDARIAPSLRSQTGSESPARLICV